MGTELVNKISVSWEGWDVSIDVLGMKIGILSTSRGKREGGNEARSRGHHLTFIFITESAALVALVPAATLKSLVMLGGCAWVLFHLVSDTQEVTQTVSVRYVQCGSKIL